jgi:hypothetical protein
MIFDSNRLQKFSFSRMSISEIHSDLKINDMIDLKIIVVFFIDWNKIIINSIQRMIDRFFWSIRRNTISCVLIKAHVSHLLIEYADSRLSILISSIFSAWWAIIFDFECSSISCYFLFVITKANWNALNVASNVVNVWFEELFSRTQWFSTDSTMQKIISFRCNRWLSMFQWISFFIILIKQIRLMENSNINATFKSWIFIESSNSLTTIFIVS